MAATGARRKRLAARRRGRVRRADNDLTTDEWRALVEAWGGCAYCGADHAVLQRDCVQPISRGGRYTLGNVVPACGSCNASKSNGEVTQWMRRRRLDERTFLVRQYEIAAALADVRAEPGARAEVADPTVAPVDAPRPTGA